MGALLYGPGETRVAIEDVLLAHLQYVITNKLRRRESFALTFSAAPASSRLAIWLNDAIPLSFEYDAVERLGLERDRIDAMLAEAAGAGGLHVDNAADERVESVVAG